MASVSVTVGFGYLDQREMPFEDWLFFVDIAEQKKEG
jgi:hypothetical protein